MVQGKTWGQVVALVGHLDQRTTQRYIHFMSRDKRETANFLVNILRQATAGKVTSEDIELMKGSYKNDKQILPNQS